MRAVQVAFLAVKQNDARSALAAIGRACHRAGEGQGLAWLAAGANHVDFLGLRHRCARRYEAQMICFGTPEKIITLFVVVFFDVVTFMQC